MRKFKFSSLALFGAIALSAASCGSPSGGGGSGSTKGPMVFWHNFGEGYSADVNEALISPLADEGLAVEAEGKKGYDNLHKAIVDSTANGQWPNISTAYPDHLADYSRVRYPRVATGILVDLNKYLNDTESELNKRHMEKYGRLIKDDYYPEYMVENQSISYDENDNAFTVGLPFNKSTEVVGYNGVFFDYTQSLHTEITRVPATWAEWAAWGPLFRHEQLQCLGKYLKYELSNGKATNFEIVSAKPSSGKFLDFSEVTDPTQSAVLSWDSGANMFITLVRQFGAEFTSYTAEDRKDPSLPVQSRHGYVEWFSDAYKSKTLEAMQMIIDLSGNGTGDDTQVFAPSDTFGNYSSGAFSLNAVLFTICSTGGLSYNINDGQEFRVAPVPYKDADHKFVISQGANVTVFDQSYIGSESGKSYTEQEMADMCFETVVKMTTGDYQAKFASLTGYFPASKSATESQVYQDFLKGDETDVIKKAYRDGAKLNNDEYMDTSKKWTKFVDPGFLGSSGIRDSVNLLVSSLIRDHTAAGFNLETKLQDFYTSKYSSSDPAKNYIR